MPNRKALPGSDRQVLPGARAVGKANPNERLEVTLVLRRRSPGAFAACVAAAAAGDASKRVAHEDFAAQYGADSADIAAVRAFATRSNLAVVREAPERRTVILSGTVAQFEATFGIGLQMFDHDNGSYRGRTGPIYLPNELAGIVVAVLGLDNRPQAKPHFRMCAPRGNVIWNSAAATDVSYPPTEVATLYEFPSGSGKGQTIGIVELGGGYRPADLQTYFAQLKVDLPTVTAVSVDHGTNKPTGSADGPDGEVMLDIEVAGAVAPDAGIVVYFAPNTDAGFLDAVTSAIHDTVNKPSVISISWGGPESSWTAQAMTAFDQAFQSAATLGITVCIASGDNGSSDGVTDGSNNVDFPASSPYALGCGGTNLQSAAGKISSETVWNDGANGGSTGGGVSSFFALPTWQAGLSTTSGTTKAPLGMRGVPDVCGDADPDTGYDVLVDGDSSVFGGTSAVAPLWAGLIARINSIDGTSVGYINPQLYGTPSALNDILAGNNGSFSASSGWDACTGLGSPDGSAVAALLKGSGGPSRRRKPPVKKAKRVRRKIMRR
jgi:kumamolisin